LTSPTFSQPRLPLLPVAGILIIETWRSEEISIVAKTRKLAKASRKASAKTSTKIPSKFVAGNPPAELTTILDFLRYAVTRFAAAKLAYGQGTFDPIEEATLLIAETLGLPVDGIDPFLPARITADERRRIFSLIEKRVRLRVPAAYLVNCAYLQGTRFYIDQRVIVPRSYLAELLYGDLFNGDEPLVDGNAVTTVLELCTGSGCLAVLACDVFPNARVDAVDISNEALRVAAINVSEHDLQDRITLLKGDLFEPIGNKTYDIILANPPYVTTKAVAELPAEFSHEPRLALEGGADGMDIVRRILAKAGRHLNEDGGLLCEIGRGRGVLERDNPDKDLLWLDTAQSSGEVFWIPAASLQE
jgi:ribosomal protein L3 glutamine methyltransferase